MPDTCQDGRVKPTVLIIDDDPDIQGLVQATLQEDGVVVTPAYTAAQAEEELGREMFAAIILDLGLPDMPGEELLTKIRKELPDVPVLVLSGQREPTSVVACMQAGAIDYIAKPFDPMSLAGEVRAAAGR